MFTTLENKVVTILRDALPEALVPPTRIVQGPVAPPLDLPTIVFSTGDFEAQPQEMLSDIPRADHEVNFALTAQLEVWADSMAAVEEISLKAMAALTVNHRAITDNTGGEWIMDNLKLSFEHLTFWPQNGSKHFQDGTPPNSRISYKVQSAMTVTRLDFGHETIKVIDTLVKDLKPLKVLLHKTAPILLLPAESLRGVGVKTAAKLAAKGLRKIVELCEAAPAQLMADIPQIAQHIAKAREMRRIANNMLKQIVDRVHPVPENYFAMTLVDMAALAPADIKNLTGKNAQSVNQLLDDLNQLETELLDSAAFNTLYLKDFI
jgi:hypothetical protein